ncbi:MAG: metal ABC transporter permease, partial [Victivallales bacterium]|nr:metal ABC transporter permease [Victivallales bacterium]
MNLVGSLLISALIVFPALAAMRICNSFLNVTIWAAILSVGCAVSGMLVSIVSGTPVGSTIVTADIVVFLICSMAGMLIRRFSVRKTVLALLSVLSLLRIGCESEKRSEHPKEEQKLAKEEYKIDLDLTLFNPRMVYMQVFYMTKQPQAYAGQTIRMKGTYAVMINRTTQERHTYCNVSDSTGCCSAMIRFILSERQNKQLRNGEIITIRGIFEIIEENGEVNGILQKAVLE